MLLARQRNFIRKVLFVCQLQVLTFIPVATKWSSLALRTCVRMVNFMMIEDIFQKVQNYWCVVACLACRLIMCTSHRTSFVCRCLGGVLSSANIFAWIIRSGRRSNHWATCVSSNVKRYSLYYHTFSSSFCIFISCVLLSHPSNHNNF